MNFNSLVFGVIFSIFFVIYWLCTSNNRSKILLLSFGSLAFYSTWNVSFIPVLLATAILDYIISKKLLEAKEVFTKNALVFTSIIVNISVLFYFKYSKMFIEISPHNQLATIFRNTLPPLGISFYIFQSISFVVDVYRGQLKKIPVFSEFISSIIFFPHLMAGPLIRVKTFIPQFHKLIQLNNSILFEALALITVGLVKKSIGDLVAPLVDTIFHISQPLSFFSSWIGILSFSTQLYCDFSGYTDIALGLALLLGFKLPKNFNLPYLAQSPRDFWRRWHITLSKWLRDYIYFPLRSSKYRGISNPFIATLIVFILCGIWHGAGLSFLAFGIYHGILVCLDRWQPRLFHNRLSSTLLTFYCVSIGWVFFRISDMKYAFKIIGSLHGFSENHLNTGDLSRLFFVVSLLVLSHFLDAKYLLRLKPVFLIPTVIILIAVGIIAAGPDRNFIYFYF